MVRRSMSSIEPDIDQVVGSSPFLQQHASDNKCAQGIAFFHRSEIQTGRLLGRGGFSLVSEITAFRLNPAITARCSPDEQALRERYEKSAMGRNGEGRYCVKHLQERLLQSPKDFQVAASDLAVEASYLSALDHPNILSVRGLPIDGLQAWRDGQHDGYFIVMDRLEETLEQRIDEWSKVPEQAPTLEAKAEYAKQLADALQYLHEHRIIFRDMKPQNVGFSVVDNTIQLFDFGLCRELPPECEACHGTFFMSGVGTRRYMACELFLNGGEYNLKADVYSWALLFWEMLSLTKPYALLTEQDHQVQVCREGLRPTLDDQWPMWIRTLLRQSWQADVNDRVSMHQLTFLMQAKLNEATAWDAPRNGELDTSYSKHEDDGIKKTSEPMPISPSCVSDFRLEGLMVPSSAFGFEPLDPVPSIHEEEESWRDSPPTNILPQKECCEREQQDLCTTGSVDDGSVDHNLISPEIFDASPPPAPKKPAALLHVPEHVVKNISLKQDLSAEDDVSGICSYNDEDSFARHSSDSMDCDLWLNA